MPDYRRYVEGDFSTRIKDIQSGYGHRGLKLFLEGMIYDQLWAELQQFEDNLQHFWLLTRSVSTIEKKIKVDIHVFQQTISQIPIIELPGGWEVEVKIKEIEK